jgi:hypothetical protein
VGFFWGVDDHKMPGTKKNFFGAMFEKIIGQKPGNLRLTVVPGIAIDQPWSN